MGIIRLNDEYLLLPDYSLPESGSCRSSTNLNSSSNGGASRLLKRFNTLINSFPDTNAIQYEAVNNGIENASTLLYKGVNFADEIFNEESLKSIGVDDSFINN